MIRHYKKHVLVRGNERFTSNDRIIANKHEFEKAATKIDKSYENLKDLHDETYKLARQIDDLRNSLFDIQMKISDCSWDLNGSELYMDNIRMYSKYAIIK